MARTLVVVLAALSLLAAPLAISAGASSDADFARTAKKAKKCKAKQVSVTVGKRKRVCRPLARFLPRPRAGDSRRIGVEGALSLDLGRVGGKRIPSLKSVLGRRRAATVRRKLLKLLPKLIKRVDKAGSARVAANLDDCGSAGPDFNQNTGGGSLGVSNGRGQISAPAGGGFRVRMTFPATNCDKFDAPPCPTAAGVVEGRLELPRDIHLLIYEDDELVLNQGYRTTERAKLRGQVEDDAKLDHLDIEDTVTYHFSAGGSAVGRHVLLDATIARTARVNMRTPNGTYVPSQAAVRMLLRINGRSVGPEEELQNATTLAEQFKEDFANLVQRAIRNYRALETDWNRANACAKIEFSPRSGDQPLSRGQTGTVTATVSAQEGGAPPSGRWTISGPVNATFTPARASANPFAPSFTVSSSGAGHEVRGDFRVTSRAGVAEDPWTEPINELPNQISGTWHNVVQTEGLHFDVTFNATFRKGPSSSPNIKAEYELTSGTGTWQVSGTEGTCNVNGSGPFSVGGGAVLLTTPGNATPGPPFSYLMQTQSPQNTTTYSYFGCDDPEDDGPREMPIPFSGLNITGISPDGFAYNGSKTESSPPDHSSEETWSFTGTS